MNKVSVIERQSRLVAEVEAIAKSRKLGARFQEEVTTNLTTLRQAITSLQTLHDILDLSELDTELRGRKSNLEYWRQLPPGRYAPLPTNADSATQEAQERAAILKNLHTTHSLTLNTLYKASMDFISITKPSEKELQFATDLGAHFQEMKRTWTLFKRFYPQRAPISFKWHAFRSGQEFFDLLVKHGVIESYSLQLQRDGAAKEAINKPDVDRLFAKKKLGQKDLIWIEYEGLNTKLIPLVTGHWFEIFTYGVFEQTLDRLVGEYEIYSRVDFEVKEHLKTRARSDFDLLVGLPDQIVMAECKSGGINKDDMEKMLENSALLKRVFHKMGIEKFLFVLVFSPTDDPSQSPYLEELCKNDFVVVEPYNIGPFLNAHVQGLPPPDGLVWSQAAG